MLVLTATVIIVAEGNGIAQSPNVPNFSGTWELIEYGGRTKRELGSKFPKMKLAILQTDAEVKITQTRMKNRANAVRFDNWKSAVPRRPSRQSGPNGSDGWFLQAEAGV
jgi:hypothetical protein